MTDTTMINDQCRHCGAEIEVYRWVIERTDLPKWGSLGTTSCQKCIDEYEVEKHKKEMIDKWRERIPKSYRDTDRSNPLWPSAYWQRIRVNEAHHNLLVLGELGIGKSRVAIEWMKVCMWSQKWTFGHLFADDIHGFHDEKENESWLRRYSGIGILVVSGLLDEIQTDPTAIRWAKRLLKNRLRNEKPTIITGTTKPDQFIQIGKDYYRNDREWIADQLKTQFTEVNLFNSDPLEEVEF